LVTDFYSDGSYRYVVNVGEITDKIACAAPSSTPTAQPTSTPTAQPTSTPTRTPTQTPAPLVTYYELSSCDDVLYKFTTIPPDGINQRFILPAEPGVYYIYNNNSVSQNTVPPTYDGNFQKTGSYNCSDPAPTSTATAQPTSTPTAQPTPTPSPAAAITATVSGSNVSCSGGSNGGITVSSISGGSGGPYETKLNVGGTYTSTTSYGGLTAGSYTIYVKDSASTEATFPITITQPSSLGIFAQKTGFDQIYASVSGGASGSKTFELYSDNDTPYAIGGGTLVDTLYDSTSVTFNSVVAGYYYVVATDGNGCSETTAYMITV
jgi:hypothetical protein